jgi:hypothetical protein
MLRRWSLSIEAIAFLPQLVLLRKSDTKDVTVHYLVALQGASRGFDLLCSIYLTLKGNSYLFNDLDSWTCIIQTVLAIVAIRKIFLRHTNTPATESIIPALSSKMTSCLLFILRYIQLGTSAIAIYLFSYLVWAYNNHYCAWYGLPHCTETEMNMSKVPWSYMVLITVVPFSHDTLLTSSVSPQVLKISSPHYSLFAMTTNSISVVSCSPPLQFRSCIL